MAIKKLAKTVSVFLVATMMATMLGCGKDTKTSDPEPSPGSTSSTPTSSGLPIVKDKITLKILSESRADMQLGNDMPVFKELEKRTNVHLEWQLLPVTKPEEKFNLIMASGELPDLISFNAYPELLIKYGMQGAIIPVQDLIKKHAPDIKKALDNPLPEDKLPYKMDCWGEITASDGNIYNVPLISSSNAIGAVYAIRVDWLDKLNLKMPETLDDLYKVLKAFKEGDPNGNGKPDELPFISGQGNKTATILPLVNAYGAHMDLYVDKDDKIKYGPVEPQYKEGLQFLNKLYKEGLLESDYLTSTRDQWTAKAGGNQAGLMYVWPSSGIAATNTNLAKLDSNFKFMPMAPVKGPKGHQYKDTKTAGRFLAYRTSITSANKYPVETMKYLNYCFTEEGTLLTSYGIEGLHYNMVNGQPEYTDLITKNKDGLDPETARIKDGIDWLGLPYQIGWESHFKAMKDAAPATVRAWELYREPGMVEAPFPTLKYTDDELAIRNQIITEIDTYKDAMIDKFIMGVESTDKFEEFVQKINKAGLPELLKVCNDAYERYKKTGSK